MKNRFLLLGLFICALGCDSASPVAPTGSVLSITANPTQINLNGGTARITVTGFKPDGNPLNPGTQLVMSTDIGDLVDPTTGALISVIEVAGNGQAVALLRADGRPGAAMVTATLTTGGDATAMATVQIGETVESQPTLVLSANPSIVDVLELSRISILARNSDGTPVGSNQRIRLTSNLGTLHSSSSASDTRIIDSADTDSNGEAVAFYRAGDQSGMGQVSGILGTSEETVLTLDVRDVATDFSFSPDQTFIPVSGGSLQLTAVVVNARNEGVSNILVRFDTRNPSVGGSFSPSSAVLTTGQGVSTATLTLAGSDLGGVANFEVTATVTINGESVTQAQEIRVDGG